MPLVLGFVALLGGVILLASGITEASFADVIQGRARAPADSPTSSSSSTGSAAVAGSTAGATAGTIGDVSIADLHTRAATRGWSLADVADWVKVITRESGGRLTAQNPSSNAYGIAQGIDGPAWYVAHGGNATTVSGQLDAMENYIAQRYGTPTAAWAHEQQFGWY